MEANKETEKIKLENIKAKDSVISAIGYMRLLDELYKEMKTKHSA